MKHLIKNSIPFVLLVLIGYAQVFAHIQRDNFSPVIAEKRSHHLENPVTQASGINSDYFEADNKKNLLKGYVKNDPGAEFFYGHVPAEFFFQRALTISAFVERSARLSASRVSLFQILRL